MFKPTKKQHVVNKAYADKNGGSGGGSGLFMLDNHLSGDTKYFIGSQIDYIIDNVPVAILINNDYVVYLQSNTSHLYESTNGDNSITIYQHVKLVMEDLTQYDYNSESGNYELKLGGSPK